MRTQDYVYITSDTGMKYFESDTDPAGLGDGTIIVYPREDTGTKYTEFEQLWNSANTTLYPGATGSTSTPYLMYEIKTSLLIFLSHSFSFNLSHLSLNIFFHLLL